MNSFDQFSELLWSFTTSFNKLVRSLAASILAAFGILLRIVPRRIKLKVLVLEALIASAFCFSRYKTASFTEAGVSSEYDLEAQRHRKILGKCGEGSKDGERNNNSQGARI